jgi:large subunit ribosomal protein L24
MVARVRSKDTVFVVSGKDAGQQGTVIEISPKDGKVKVKGVGLVTRHVKPRRQGEAGSIKKTEKYLNLSQVMPVCSSCKKPARVRVKLMENGEKVRACHRCEGIM